MRTLSFALGLMLLLIIAPSCSANAVAMQDISHAAKCCFEFDTGAIPLRRITSINTTDPRCSQPAFLITTVIGKELCAKQTDPWAKRAFKELHPIQPYSSSTMSTVAIQETPLEKCCSEFSPPIPRHKISSINATDTRCTEPVFLITTDTGQELCANQTDPWAKRAYDELYPNRPDTSSTMSKISKYSTEDAGTGTFSVGQLISTPCCFDFLKGVIRRKNVVSIRTTDGRCPEPAFLITTKRRNKLFCVRQSAPWAQRLYEESIN